MGDENNDESNRTGCSPGDRQRRGGTSQDNGTCVNVCVNCFSLESRAAKYLAPVELCLNHHQHKF
jgi:hypothetical protein